MDPPAFRKARLRSQRKYLMIQSKTKFSGKVSAKAEKRLIGMMRISHKNLSNNTLMKLPKSMKGPVIGTLNRWRSMRKKINLKKSWTKTATQSRTISLRKNLIILKSMKKQSFQIKSSKSKGNRFGKIKTDHGSISKQPKPREAKQKSKKNRENRKKFLRPVTQFKQSKTLLQVIRSMRMS